MEATDEESRFTFPFHVHPDCGDRTDYCVDFDPAPPFPRMVHGEQVPFCDYHHRHLNVAATDRRVEREEGQLKNRATEPKMPP